MDYVRSVSPPGWKTGLSPSLMANRAHTCLFRREKDRGAIQKSLWVLFFLVVFSITQPGARSTHFLSPGASQPGLPGTAAPPTRRPSAPSWRPPAPHQLLGLARRCQPCVPAVPPPSSVRSSSCWHCGTCWHRQLCQHRVSADLSPSRGPLLRCGRASTPSSPALPGSLAPETGVGKQPYPF